MACKISLDNFIIQIPSTSIGLLQHGQSPDGRAWFPKALKLSDYNDFNADHE